MEDAPEQVIEPIVWDGPIIAGMPVFNEEETVGSVVLSCKPQVDEVLCVDDGSSDSSSRIARSLGATVHHHRANRGYGGALKTIFDTAKERRSRTRGRQGTTSSAKVQKYRARSSTRTAT